MDLKKKYEEESKQKPYCWTKSGQYVKSGSYSDGYVKWLEKQLLLHNVVGQSEQLVSFLRQYQKTCEIMHVNKIDAKNFVEQYKTN